jgi:hypothetical protein
MNIFVLDENPIQAANKVPAKVASKMALEAAQMLAVACSMHSLKMPHKKDGNEYSAKSHVNHPCTKWTCASEANMAWLAIHGLSLCVVHDRTYGKIPAHASALQETLSQLNSELWCKHTPFVSAMPEEYKTNNIVESYNAYIKTKPYFNENSHSQLQISIPS